jgi:ribosomal protein L31
LNKNKKNPKTFFFLPQRFRSIIMLRTTRLASQLVQIRHASTQATKPEKFLQTIVLSNGATYTVRTTSPTRNQIRLTKDTRNHPLWNPAMLKEGVTDESEQLTKFQKRFGDLDLGDISWIESDEAVSAAMKKVVASGGATKKAAVKGKRK